METKPSWTDTLFGYFDWFSPLQWMESPFWWIHETFGTPWWVLLMGLAFVLRAALFPTSLLNQKNMVGQKKIAPALKIYQDKMQSEKDTQKSLQLRKEMSQIYKKNGVDQFYVFKNMLLQGGAFVSAFMMVRHLTEHPDLKVGGISWFTDLSVADPTMVLPLLSALITAVGMYVPDYYSNQVVAGPQKYLKWAIRVVPFGVLYITYTFPAAFFVFWTASAFAQLIQNILISHPYGKYRFGIKTLDSAGNEIHETHALIPESNLVKGKKEMQLLSSVEWDAMKKKK
jgi:YidC/Oxa1 family membrane protein insertase